MNDLLIVLSNPKDGRHEDFNDWYSNIHIRDVMRLPGTAAVQRLRLAPESADATPGLLPDRAFDYLAVYECYDIELVSAGHGDVFTPKMLISDSFDFVMREAYYEPLAQRRKRNAAIHDGDYVLERISATQAPDFAEWYKAVRLPALMALPGVVSGTFAGVAAHQMLAPHDDSHFVGLYRTQDRQASLRAWAIAPPMPPGLEARVACYTPVIPRWVAFDVVHPSAAARQAEARARVAIGGKVYHAFPTNLALA
jgi:hypothetical protein